MEIALKVVSSNFNPIQLTLERFFIGSLVLLPFAIKSLKSKILLAGIIFMLVGTTVGLIGLGMTGFKPDRLLKWKEGRWYQTVN